MKKNVLRQLIMLSKRLLYAFLVQLFMCSVLLANTGNAQRKTIEEVTLSVHLEGKTLSQFFQQVENKTNFKFTYNDDLVDLDQKLSVNGKNLSLYKLLESVSRQTELHFVQVNENIHVKSFTGKSEQAVEIADLADVTISGTVKDAKGEPIPGVTISLPGTTVGTATDLDGRYTLTVPEGSTLVFSFIGFEAQRIAIADRSLIDVVLSEDMASLDEVVVVGYGSQKKVNLTGAISTVNMDDVLRSRPLSSISSALQGQIPGLEITSSSGKPGEGSNINIRGMTSINGGSPLVLVDNVPADLESLNPADIETVTVLKDASASAIYGGRAAFGVILVTTKKAKMNEPLRFNYSTNLTLGQPSDLIEKGTLLETVRGLKAAGNNTAWLDGQDLDIWEQLALEYKDNPSLYPDGSTYVDSRHYPLRETDIVKNAMGNSFQQIHNFSVSGGADKSNFRISLGIADEDGILKTRKDRFQKLDLNVYINTAFTNKLTHTLNAFYNSRVTYRPASYQDLFGKLVSDGNWAGTGYREIDGELLPYETVENLLEYEIPDKNTTDNLRLFNKLQYDIIDGLKLIGEYTYENTVGEHKSSQSNRRYASAMLSSSSELNTTTSYSRSFNKTQYHALNIFTQFDKVIENHELSVLLGLNRESSNFSGFSARRNDLLNIDYPSLSLAYGSMTNGENINEFALLGYFGRMNYSYKNKYLIEANGRYDGSSRFPKKTRFGFFPSVSAGWVISEELFMESIDQTINFLKLRGSYGEIGNQSIANYMYYPSMNVRNASWVDPNTNKAALKIESPALVSSSFTWERVLTKNAGLDLVLFRRLNASFDYFERETIGMLGNAAQVPSVLGTSAPKQNVANLVSKGWETSLTWRSNEGNEFFYSLGINLSDNRASVTKFDNEEKLLSQYYEGQKIGEIWGFETYGLYQVNDFVGGTLNSNLQDGTLKEGIPSSISVIKQNPGDIRFTDLNGDGIINQGKNTLSDPGDQKIIGNNTRRYQFGINGHMEYKSLDFSIFLQGIGKRDVWRATQYNANFWPYVSRTRYFQKSQLDYWTPENTDAYFPRMYPDAGGNTGVSRSVQTRYLSNGAYLRVRNIELGYTIPQSLLQKIKFARARIFITAENPFTFKHLPKGQDPEVRDESREGVGYPFMKKYSFGLNLSF